MRTQNTRELARGTSSRRSRRAHARPPSDRGGSSEPEAESCVAAMCGSFMITARIAWNFFASNVP